MPQREARQAGWSAPAIAEQLGCSAATVYRRLDATGIARRRVNPRLTRHQLNEALDHGLSAPAMAARFGASVACVCRALAREGLMTASQAAKQQPACGTPITTASRTADPPPQPSA